jgi:signal transduction histidine kinase
LIVLLIAVAFVADRVVWPSRIVLALYAVPMLLASVLVTLRQLVALIVGCLLVAIVDVYLTGLATSSGAAGIAALLIVAVVALNSAICREKLRNRVQRQQSVLLTVERLRQPLTVIVGYVQILQRTPIDSAAATRAIESIRRASRCMKEMLDDILAREGPT